MKLALLHCLSASLFAFAFLPPGTAEANEANPELPARGISVYGAFSPDHPEFTLPAIEEAVKLGAQMIALEIHLTKDLEVVVIKDDKVDRTTDGSGAVSEFLLPQLQALNAAAHHDRASAPTKIPTLAEALAVIPEHIRVECRLNGDKTIAFKAMEIVKNLNRQPQVILSCDREQARAVKRVDANALICNMQHRSSYEDYVEASIGNAYAFVFWKGSKQRLEQAPELGARLKDNGIAVIYYHSAVAPENISELFSAGADFIQVSNDVPQFLQAVAEAQQP